MSAEPTTPRSPVDPIVMRFEDLPLITDDIEHRDGWQRHTKRLTTVGELLETWDIDDYSESAEMAQVLRHLRETTTALRLCLHVIEKGIEVRMMDQWPALVGPLEEAKVAARKALSA